VGYYGNGRSHALRPALLAVTAIAVCACAERTQPSSERHAASDAKPSVRRIAAATRTTPPPKPSGPPVRLFAKRFVVKVRRAPERQSPRIGYLRGGMVMQATSAEPLGFVDCRKGWYGLDTGGFLCSTLDVTPFIGKRLPERQSLLPDLTAPLPYPYGYSKRRNTPVFRRLPSDEEAVQYEVESKPVAALSAQALALGLPAPPPAPPIDVSPVVGAEAEGEPPEPGVPTLASLMGDQSSVLMRRMERGFYVSLDREMPKGTRSYWRTQSNGFIPAKGLSLVQGSAFHGVVLEEQGAVLPIGFVMSKDFFAYTQDARGRARPGSKPGYHFEFPIASEVEIQGKAYAVAEDGSLYLRKNIARIEARAKPDEVLADEKWIDIDLGAQSLIAYVGSRPVYATLISSGRIKDELDPQKNFETPAGTFRILSKHLTATMDGDHALDGPYSIEDVPYVMYFQLAYALHSAFWHNSFGRPHSHGCINLAPLDAKWVFEFAEPVLPKGWHGVYPKDRLGTRLYIHGTTPAGERPAVVNSIVIFVADVRDQVFALHPAQHVLHLDQLDEEIVLRIQPGSGHRALVIEREPLLDAAEAGAVREVHQDRQVEHDRRGQDRITAQEVDLDLHRIAEPSDDIEVVPTFLLVAARWVILDANLVIHVAVERRIAVRL
jgi:lipoprotein-anchoring transpeptidase ErfK/SrfK